MIRKMQIEDLETVLNIEQASFQAPYTHEQYLYEIEDNPCAYLYVFEINEKIIGYIDFWITFDSCQLCKIAIEASEQGKGYAKALMELMFEEAIKQECEAALLEVRTSNQHAIQFYESFEFLKINIRKNYYNNPTEDGIVMGKVLVGE